MTLSVFIDGGEGTTGLEIRDRLAARAEIELIALEEPLRKDTAARAEALHSADIAILCLPDDAAREAVELTGDANTRIIDASTAHRSDDDWTYGFAELEPDHRQHIRAARRVTNPGCYALTFVALIRPLVSAGVISPDALLTVNATSGYSGGGKAMIAEFESGTAPTAYRNYALTLQHKHLPEMAKRSGLTTPPLFSPSVANTYRGMIVEVPLTANQLTDAGSLADIRGIFEDHYADAAAVRIAPQSETDALANIPIERRAGSDLLEIMLFGSTEAGQLRLVGVIDNLGKGAAGSAVQSLNLMAGFDETAGLRL
ncbi:MAG: N-acetyl-gamma-glutamyl-phosphate reductase [Sphingomonadaceae bacterium]|nr:N-acetyl-gamma-glutamyl-phosphate reductase [Sphingomonadaceae bacterium]